MIDDERADYVTRDTVLKLLSDQEVARVSTAEAAAGLTQGEEYVDLEDLHGGVRRAVGPSAPVGRLLPRKAVRAETWEQILTILEHQPWA